MGEDHIAEKKMIGFKRERYSFSVYNPNTAGVQEKFSPSQKVNMVLILVKMAEEWLL
jgi:hypothetical protein